MIETIGTAINIAHGRHPYLLPEGYDFRSSPEQRRELRRTQNVAHHHGDAWWERYTARLMRFARYHSPWPTRLQREAWWFHCGGADSPTNKRNLLWNVSFAEFIICHRIVFVVITIIVVR